MYRFVAAILCLALPQLAFAQSGQFNFTFDGKVTSTPDQGATQFTTANERVPWTTPALGQYPVQNGDTLQIVFQGTLPSFSNPALQSRLQADGSYRLTGVARGPEAAANNPELAYIITNIVVGTLGGLAGIDPTMRGFDLLYNPTTGAASLDFGADGGFRAGGFDLPAYQLSADGTAVTTNGRTFSRVLESGSTALGTADNITFSAAPIYRQGTLSDVGRQGPLTVSGRYSIPTASGSTAVPEPDVIILFGMATAALYWGRRRGKLA
jgi:hypothetical protein